MEWTSTQRHYNSADVLNGPKTLPRSKTFRLRVRFLSLFSRRLVIKEVSLIEPNVVWPQNAEGKWRLPSSQAMQSSGVSPKQTASVSQSQAEGKFVEKHAAPVVASTSTTLSSPAQVTVARRPRAPRTQTPRLAVAPEVRRVSVKDGNFSFLDRAGGLLASFTGVDFRTNIRSASALRGDAIVARISLRDRFFSNNCVPRSGTSPTSWNFPRFLPALQTVKSTATSRCNLKRRIHHS